MEGMGSAVSVWYEVYMVAAHSTAAAAAVLCVVVRAVTSRVVGSEKYQHSDTRSVYCGVCAEFAD